LKKFSLFLLISLVIHFLLIVQFKRAPIEDEIQYAIKKGLSVSFQSRINHNSGNTSSLFENSNLDINNDELGTVVTEINDIKNAIQYPADALEQGLESECEWKVLIGKGGASSKVELNKPCKYKIFEKEFMRVIGSWKFRSPENTWLEIPVRFKIERDKDG
jgi:TonB family protein